MMTTKPLASLSPALLARKGAARPAMRPQGFAFDPSPATGAIDDLGWNDMGHPAPPAEATPIAGPVPVPAVLVEREALAQRIEAPAPVRSVAHATVARYRRETSHAGKAALTLRLDADRHLKLRLAGAITNRSAQDLLVQALDALIDAVPTVDALVAQLGTAPHRKR